MAKLSLINVSYGNTSKCVVRIHLVCLIKICQYFVIYHLQTQLPKTYFAAEVMGLGFFGLIKSLDFDISIIYN